MDNEKKDFRPRLSEDEYELIKSMRSTRNKNILVVGDLHLPFELDDYFDFIVEQYKRWNCNQIIFIGDIVDNHYSSYHEANPDLMSAGDELELSVQRLKKWYKEFPEATVIIGNHDRLASRKMVTAGVSKRWIRSYNEVLGVPNWKFMEEYQQDNVLYIHGEGVTAKARSKQEMISIVQGHRHTEAEVSWSVGANFKVFGMQVGTGIDRKSFAFGYAKNFKKQVVSCGLVLNNGQLPIVIPMDL